MNFIKSTTYGIIGFMLCILFIPLIIFIIAILAVMVLGLGFTNKLNKRRWLS